MMDEAVELMLRPIRLATSKTAQKTYLNTALFTATAVVLFGFASSAYSLFYWKYVPSVGVEKTVYLQYGHGSNPYAVVDIGQSIIPQQAYDVAVQMDLPRSPPNLEMGNFMVDLVMLSPTYNSVREPVPTDSFDTRSLIPTETILFSSRRPAILTYQPEVVTLGKQLASLPSYVLGWRKAEERLLVPMAEGVVFEKGWKNVPNKVYIDLQNKVHDVQVYNLRLILKARLSGIRWLMYNHRIISFIFFTGAFWAAELVCAALALLALQSLMGGTEADTKLIKKEEYGTELSKVKEEEAGDVLDMDDLDLSDTPRSFPTYGRQAPLRYVPKIKSEYDSEEMVSDEVRTHPKVAEADDESEELVDVGSAARGGRSDSGLGTSYSESGATVQRRRSKGRMAGI